MAVYKKMICQFGMIIGGLLHSHIPLRDAADPPGQRSDSAWRCWQDLLLPVPRPEQTLQPGGDF